MDASEFKEYIFGALFLKRASDVFEEEYWRIVALQRVRGRSSEEALVRAEDPDSYSEAFFVPEGVLQHIDFNRRVGTTTVSDKKWRDLIDHFSKYRLRNEDFEFPDLLGAAYEYLVRDFADSAGKKGGEFYTPRQVVRLMVRLVDPQEGMAVYDPCSGSGGMLIYARDHVAESGGDPRDLILAGQETNGTTWSISKMNMLLHDIRDADIRNNDTLTDPAHVRDGELTRFDRVITNPPFSQNYDKAALTHTERFCYGYTSEAKKADLMFLQHMLAVLKRDGMVATVMPHGVLFRGGAEGEIRRRIIEEDLLDTVIGLGPNLFYGTGIPAAILILRAKGSKPPDRRCKVLFINADRDYGEGRAQNRLRPRDEEKITATYRNFVDVDGFARVVTIDELAENDFNCNIRRYADNAPLPEPHDVRAHLHGGVPMVEIDDAAGLLARAGLEAATLFEDRGDGYADWCHIVTSANGRDDAHRAIADGVAKKASTNPWAEWWADTVDPMLLALPDTGILVGQRRRLVEEFVVRMTPVGMDRFEAAGLAATWWESSAHELASAANRGWKSVIDGWLTTAEAAADDKKAPDLADQIAIRLLANSELAERADLVADRDRLEAEIKAAEASGDEDDEPDDAVLSPAQIKKLKSARTKARRAVKAVDASLLDTARTTLDTTSPDDAPAQAIGALRDRIEALIVEHFSDVERSMLVWYDNLADKYGTTLRDLEAERKASAARVEKHLTELGYG